MNKKIKNQLVRNSLFALFLSCFFTLSACHNDHHHDSHEAEEQHDDDHHHSSDEIILDAQKAAAAGVETTTINRGPFNDVILVSGSLTAASCDEVTIVATVSGVISDHGKHISEGMAISQGETVYHITSDKLQDGDQAQRTRINFLAAKREYERALPLVEDKIISEKDFSVIRTEYESARLAYEAIGNNTSSKGVSVKSPVSGYMKECMVTDGDYVEVGTPLMVVTKNQHLYLRAEVPVRHFSALGSIRSAKFRTQYSNEFIDLNDVGGTLLSSGKSVVSTSSYVPVTFQLDNKGDIVPGSYAEVFLITGEREGVLSVPTTALTEEQGIYYIYIKRDEDCYRKQEVTLGATDGEFTEITDGLNEGEQVVTKGAINVKLASASSAIPAHNHQH